MHGSGGWHRVRVPGHVVWGHGRSALRIEDVRYGPLFTILKLDVQSCYLVCFVGMVPNPVLQMQFLGVSGDAPFRQRKYSYELGPRTLSSKLIHPKPFYS